MIRVIERRIRRLELERRRSDQAGRSLAEIIRERRRKRLVSEGKEPEPELPPFPHFDERGRPLTIGQIIRQKWLARRARERTENSAAADNSKLRREI